MSKEDFGIRVRASTSLATRVLQLPPHVQIQWQMLMLLYLINFI